MGRAVGRFSFSYFSFFRFGFNFVKHLLRYFGGALFSFDLFKFYCLRRYLHSSRTNSFFFPLCLSGIQGS